MTEMKLLETNVPEVYNDFLDGNFVVKRSEHGSNQVPIDQATEWQKRMCKISNGIIGITHNDTARDRFCITWCERLLISENKKIVTRELYLLEKKGNHLSKKKTQER